MASVRFNARPEEPDTGNAGVGRKALLLWTEGDLSISVHEREQECLGANAKTLFCLKTFTDAQRGPIDKLYRIFRYSFFVYWIEGVSAEIP